MRLLASLLVAATASANTCSCQPGVLSFDINLGATGGVITDVCPQASFPQGGPPLVLNDAVQMINCTHIDIVSFAEISQVEIVEYDGTYSELAQHSSAIDPGNANAVEVNTTTLSSFATESIRFWEIYFTGKDSDGNVLTGDKQIVVSLRFRGDCDDYDLLQQFGTLDVGGFVTIVSRKEQPVKSV